MSQDIKAYRVFIASPGGLQDERKAFREAINDYNESDAVPRGVMFLPVGWENTLRGVGRPQSMINDDLRSCDYMVLLLWDTWGTPPDEPGKGTYTSGTQEEFEVACECYKDAKHPMQQIVHFFKGVDPRHLADPGKQLQQVLDHKKKIERTHFYGTFDSINEFQERLRRQLAQWLRDHENGRSKDTKNAPVQPMHSTTDGLGLGPPATELSASAVMEIPAALKDAWKLADDGNLTEAEAKFAQAVARGDDAAAFIEYGKFLARIGRLTQAEVMFQRAIELADTNGDSKSAAHATRRLGVLRMNTGTLTEAEELTIRSAELAKKSGADDALADAYGSLGLIYRTRGDLDQAETMFQQALAIDEKLGRLEGMARGNGNLGVIYRTRGDLDGAEVMHKKALAIDEKLGRIEGMAKNYGNLGLIYETREDLEQSEAMFKKALTIDENLGRIEGIAKGYGNLGLIYHRRGDLNQAEAMHKKSLTINEKLGRLEGMAIQYANLGSIQEQRGDVKSARELWTMSRGLFAKIGMPHEVKNVQGWIDGLK